MLTIRKCTVQELDQYQEQIEGFRKRYLLQTYTKEPPPDDSNWKEMMIQSYHQFPNLLYYHIVHNNRIITDLFLFEHPLQTGGTKAHIVILYDEKTESEELFNRICETVNKWKTHSKLVVINTRQNLVNRAAEHCQFTKGNSMKWMRLDFTEINHDMLNDWAKLLPNNCTYSITKTLSDEVRKEIAEAVTFFVGDMKRDDTVVSTHLTVEDIRRMEEMDKLRKSSYKYLIVRDVNTQLIGLTYVSHKLSEPSFAYQMMTGVVPDYRRKGLGKFMKAIMYQHLMLHAPHLKGVKTNCITKNYRIIGLNEQVGFKPDYDEQEWYYQN